MVHFFSNEEWLAELPAVYSFEHILMRRQFYEGLSEPLRTELHREVGDFLERLLNQADAPGKLALEMSRDTMITQTSRYQRHITITSQLNSLSTMERSKKQSSFASER